MPRDEPQASLLASQQQADAIIWDLQKQDGFGVKGLGLEQTLAVFMGTHSKPVLHLLDTGCSAAFTSHIPSLPNVWGLSLSKPRVLFGSQL